jgi:hypothetical protein
MTSTNRRLLCALSRSPDKAHYPDTAVIQSAVQEPTRSEAG